SSAPLVLLGSAVMRKPQAYPISKIFTITGYVAMLSTSNRPANGKVKGCGWPIKQRIQRSCTPFHNLPTDWAGAEQTIQPALKPSQHRFKCSFIDTKDQ